MISIDPAAASTGSASAYVVDERGEPAPTNKPSPEIVEGRGGAIGRGKSSKRIHSSEFGNGGDS